MNNRDWMYDMYLPDLGGFKDEYFEGVDKFVEFATSQVSSMDENKIKCPCKKCRNCVFALPDEVKVHLYRRGFILDYYWWTAHGESAPFTTLSNNEHISRRGTKRSFDQLNAEQRMVFDIAGPSFVPPTWFNVEGVENSGTLDGVEDMEEDLPPTDRDGISKRFWDVLKAADEPVMPECNAHTQLSFVSRLMSLKSEYNVPQSVFNGFLELFDEILPVERIHMCPNGCMLYWKEDANKESCKFCGHARFDKEDKGAPFQVLFYLPLAPRLQRLYASDATAGHMTWHAHHVSEEGIMSHPSDGDAWKRLNEVYPDFASEDRNVRLGLSTDGFAPFAKSGQNYSCWPVIVTPYNLPPNMCMKTEYLFLSLIVPGPKNPKRLIDVCLQPLIDELMQLWESGVTTYDVSRKENFVMRAAVLWTISDFPAYAMLSGWSTAGELACPICMEQLQSKSFRLHHGGKACWFDCHRQFLESDHPFRKNKNDFRKNQVETSPPPLMLTGIEIWERVRQFATAVDDPLNYPPGYGKSHKWTKQSIFWRLPYWKHLLIRHNLDVMHIEKNVFDNVFNTVMDFPGKTKDNLKARKDIRLYCRRPELHVLDDHRGVKPKAIYTLTREDKKKVCRWLKSIKFPDGYASNVGRCVQKDDCSIAGMKSHDCHVFMERLLPIALKELLPLYVWGPLVELSILFQSICSSTLSVDHMVHLRSTVPVLICKLECIFPPGFFDSMEHLILHLPYEAQIGGPVQYRWMYPVERDLYHLKRKAVQKGRVEGSICMAYQREEISNFSVHYFPSHAPSKLRRLSRNDVLQGDDNALSIFNYPGESGGKAKTRWMTIDKEWNAAQIYVLLNCPEVQPYIGIFDSEMSGADDDTIEAEFAKWFKKYVLDKYNRNWDSDEVLWSCACGPSVKAKSWHTYKVNGYKFHTLQHGVGKSTMNSGVCVRGSNYENAESDFYGLLEEIIELEYPSSMDKPKKVVLFKCRWFDPSVRGTKVHPRYRFVEINHKRVYKKYEPFILAQQAVQVYYAEYPGARRDRVDWWHVCKTVPRGTIAERWKETAAYQSNENVTPGLILQHEETVETMPTGLRDPAGTFDIFDVDDMEEHDENNDEDGELFTSPTLSSDDGEEYDSDSTKDEEGGD